MAGSLALSGLASGVDTSGIVQQLMAIESQGRDRIVTKQGQVTAQQSALKDIASKLSALKTAAASLTDSATWTSSQTVDSSDSSPSPRR
jgi:flagellar hook-associated protein 2